MTGPVQFLLVWKITLQGSYQAYFSFAAFEPKIDNEIYLTTKWEKW